MRRVTGKKEMYTGKGDGGRTSLLGKQKVSKGSHRIDLLGELDEFTSALGLARAHSELEASRSILLAVQRDVYVLMAELAATGKAEGSGEGLDAERVKWLESQISRMTATVKTPDGFIVPGDTPAGAALDLARTVARRVERRVVRQSDRGHKVNPDHPELSQPGIVAVIRARIMRTGCQNGQADPCQGNQQKKRSGNKHGFHY